MSLQEEGNNVKGSGRRGSRERFEDDPPLPLEMEKGANSQGMQGIYYI